MMLLYSEDSLTPRIIAGGDGEYTGGSIIGLDQENLPLFEELVRAYSRQPESLERIDRLLEELTATSEGREILPEGFEELWQIFKAAGFGEKSNEKHTET